LSQGHVETLKDAYAAWNRGDLDAALAMVDEGIRWDMSERVFNPAVFEGHEAFRQDVARLGEAWEEFRFEPGDFVEVDSRRVLVLGRIRGRGRGSGVDVDLFSAHLWTFVAGSPVTMRLFRDREAALEAAGAS
jgi:ketosteroid isomerase-like protein